MFQSVSVEAFAQLAPERERIEEGEREDSGFRMSSVFNMAETQPSEEEREEFPDAPFDPPLETFPMQDEPLSEIENDEYIGIEALSTGNTSFSSGATIDVHNFAGLACAITGSRGTASSNQNTTGRDCSFMASNRVNGTQEAPVNIRIVGNASNNITIPASATNAELTVPSGRHVRITRRSTNDTSTSSIWQNNAGQRHFHVGVAGATSGRSSLTLGANINLSRNAETPASRIAGGVQVNERGILTLSTGSSIQNNRFDGNGGAVRVIGGTFNMNGGTIQNNTAVQGGGVNISETTARFNMSGGDIQDNHATNVVLGSGDGFNTQGGGGVLIQNGARFTMEGSARIRRNNTYNGGGGVLVRGEGSQFTMNNGIIENNNPRLAHRVAPNRPASPWAAPTNAAGRAGGGLNTRGGGVSVTQGATMTMGLTTSTNTPIVRGNIADQGAGIRLSFNGTLRINRGTVSNNTAGANGGGIHSSGTSVDLRAGALISGNRALGEAVPGSGGVGGGIRLGSEATLTMTGGMIENNQALRGGGVDLSNSSTFTMSAGTIRRNQALHNTLLGTSTNTNHGGGIYMDSSTRTTLSGTATITENESHSHGGGIAIMGSTHSFTMSGSVNLTNNTARNHGGGIHQSSTTSTSRISGTPVIRNNSAGQGGAINLSAGTFHFDSGTIGGTRAQGNSANQGGAVAIDSGTFNFGTATGTANPTIVGNRATGGGGGGAVLVNSGTATFNMHRGTIGHATNYNSAIRGGGVEVVEGTFNMSTATGTGVPTIIGNRATESGGGVRIRIGATFNMHRGTIGGTRANGNRAADGGGVAVEGGTFNFSTATGTGVPTIVGNQATGSGGGVRVNNSNAVFNMHRGTIGHAANYNSAANGAGIAVNAGTFNMGIATGMDVPTVIGNRATGSGGGVMINGANATFNMGRGTIGGTGANGNTATNNGGGVQLTNGTLYFRGENAKNITGNTATNGNGGGINWIDGTINTTTHNTGDVNLTNNTAGSNGGGIYISRGEFILNQGVISGNEANNGGGAYVFLGGLTLNGGQISNNEADRFGGGVYTREFANFTGNGGSVRGNHAAEDGGGIFTELYEYVDPLTDPEAYTNLIIGEDVIFEDNTAGNGAFTPPSNAETFVGTEGIETRHTSTYDHPINNYDINYRPSTHPEVAKEVCALETADGLFGIVRQLTECDFRNVARVEVGQSARYRFTVSNPYDVVLEDILITDTLDLALIEFAGNVMVNGSIALSPEDYTFNEVTGELRIYLAELPAEGATLTFDVIVLAGNENGEIPNVAHLYGPADGNGDRDRIHEDNATILEEEEGPLPPTITKSANVDRAEIGDTIGYTITVNNPNEEGLEGEFVVVDMVDVSLVDFIPGSVRVNDGVVDYDFDSETGELLVVLDPLAVGDTVITFEVEVREEAAGQTVVNVALLEVPPTFPTPEPTPPVQVEIPGEDPELVKEVCALETADSVFGIVRQLMDCNFGDTASVEAGQNARYRFTLSNPNDEVLEDILITDTLDLSLVEFVGNVRIDGVLAASPEDYTFNEATGELRIYLAELPIEGIVITFDVIVLVENEVGFEIPNVAQFFGPEDEYGNRELIGDDSATIVVEEPPSLLAPTITKSANVYRAEIGDTIGYTITVNNPNEEALEGEFVVVDTIDVSLVDFIAGSLRVNDEVVDYDFNSETGELRVVLDPLAVGDTVITFDAEVREEAAGETVVNVAFLEIPGDYDLETPPVEVEIYAPDSTEPETTAPTTDSTEPETTVPTTDLTEPGTTVPGTEPTTVPAETTVPTTTDPTQPSETDPSEPTTAPATTDPEPLHPTIRKDVCGIGDSAVSFWRYLVGLAEGSCVVPGPVVVGEYVEYVLTVSNPNDFNLYNFLVIDNLANGNLEGVRNINILPNVSYTIQEQVAELRILLDYLPANGSVTIRFEARVAEGVEWGDLINTAYLYEYDPETSDREYIGRDTETVVVEEEEEPTTAPETTSPEETTAPETTAPSTDLLTPTITKSASVNRAEVGDRIIYAITVNNPNAESLAGDFVVVDMVDVSLVNFVAGSVRVNGQLVDYSFNSTTGELRVVLNPLESGNTHITFDVIVRENAAGQTVINVAVLEVPPGTVPQPDPTPEVPVEIEDQPLAPIITKEANRSTAEVGDEIVYTIAVRNPNLFDLPGEFVVVDVIDLDLVDFIAGSVRVDSEPVDYDFNPETGELRVTLDLLPVGYTVITFVVEVREEAAGETVINVAVLEVPENGNVPQPDPTPEVPVEIEPETTNPAPTDPVDPLAPTISKEANRTTAGVGDTIIYRITVDNPNEEALVGEFVVVDMVDISLVDFVAGSVRVNGEPADYSFNSTTGELRVVLNPLEAGTTNVTFEVVVREDAAGETVVNVAILEVPPGTVPNPPPTPEVPVEIEPETTSPGPTGPDDEARLPAPAPPSDFPDGILPQTGVVTGGVLGGGLVLVGAGSIVAFKKKREK